MNYEFPVIRHIDDVLPHIEGRDEFIVAERDYGTVVNYVVMMEDTFPPIKVAGGSAKMRAERALTNAMRRECRGLKFDLDGKIAARPFFKFFNVGERDETQMKNIDLAQPHVIMDKRDGSMIHPMKIGNDIRWMTKMGITDVAIQAEDFIAKNNKYIDFAEWCINENYTPIFEWTSPSNKIVVDYDDEELVLLAVRENVSGKFLSIHP